MPSEDFSEDKLTEWIAFARPREADPLKKPLTIYRQEKSIAIECRSDRAAWEVAAKFETLGLEGEYHLQVAGGQGRVFTPALFLQNGGIDFEPKKMVATLSPTDLKTMVGNLQLSPDLKKFLKYANECVQGTIYVHKADRDNDFIVETVIPDITPSRLNKAPSECIGQAIGILHGDLASQRRAAIIQSIETGDQIRFINEFFWKQEEGGDNKRWDFITTCNHFPSTNGDDGYVVVTVRDPDTARGWRQRGHFYDLVDSGSASPTPRFQI